MRYILSARNRPVLEKFASRDVLLAFDFDGTLAPIVADPDRAALRPSTRRLLRRLAAQYPCIVVSGRSRADVRRRVSGIGFKEVIGNHGIEPGSSSHAIARAVAAWVHPLRRRLRDFHGVVVENKKFSLSVHYRKERHKRAARGAITEVARTLPGARLIGGKQVVNIVPKGAPDKGLAVERERRKRRCDRAIYVGDDETDEHAFALAGHGRLLSIRVGANRFSLARSYVRNQREIDRLLRTLIELRTDRQSR